MSKNRNLAVLAVGVNALMREKGRESCDDQYTTVQQTMPHIIAMIRSGWDVIATHGNGPQ